MNMPCTTLVFSSGGIHGVHFVGCLRALEESKILPTVRSIRGSSVGAFFATLVSLGYTAQELENALISVNTNALFQVHLDNLLHCFDTYGIDDGKRLEKVFEIFLSQKTGRFGITFQELYQYTGIHLVVVATNITSESIAYFDHKRTPDMKVSQGLRMSASIPLMFTPIEYNHSMYVDGGVLCHLALPELDEHASLDAQILTFNLQSNRTQRIDTFFSYIHTLLQCVNHTPKPSKTEYRITIPVESSGADFEMSKEKKQKAIQFGYEKTQHILTCMRRQKERRLQLLSHCILRKRIQGPMFTQPYPI